MKTVSFLASGRGSNFRAVAEKILDGTIKAEPGILITDKADAEALNTADKLGIKAYTAVPSDFESKEACEKEMIRLLNEAGTDLVAAAGYMRILSPFFIRSFKNRIINIHPSLLPSFKGLSAHKQVLDYGAKISGCTVHFVDEGTDTGPIILQASVPVLDDDDVLSLSERILVQEHRIFPEAVNLFCQERLEFSGRRVRILPEKKN